MNKKKNEKAIIEAIKQCQEQGMDRKMILDHLNCHAVFSVTGKPWTRKNLDYFMQTRKRRIVRKPDVTTVMTNDDAPATALTIDQSIDYTTIVLGGVAAGMLTLFAFLHYIGAFHP